MTPERAIETLSRTPGVLSELLSDRHDRDTLSNYGDNTFSPFDVVGHLIHGERTDWLPRIRHILEHGESTPFETFDRYAQFEESKGKSMPQLLDEFEDRRATSIAQLRALDLSPMQLQLRGAHPQLGPVTIGNILAAWAVHDQHHIAQVCKSIARQSTEDTGAFREYLGILNDQAPAPGA